MTTPSPTSSLSQLSTQSMTNLGKILKEDRFDSNKIKNNGISIDSNATQWLNELSINQRRELGKALSGKDSPALITQKESDKLIRLGVFNKLDSNQVLMNLNRVAFHSLTNNQSMDFEKQLKAVHQFMQKQYGSNDIESIEAMKNYFDKNHEDYDPSYQINYYSVGDDIIAANVSWSFNLKNGTKVHVSDYNTPMETGLPKKYKALDALWLSQEFMKNLSAKGDIVMAEAEANDVNTYLKMGFTQDPAPYTSLYSGESKTLLLFSKDDRIVDLHDLFSSYVENLGETTAQKPEVKERLEKNIQAHSEKYFKVKLLLP